MHFYKGPNKQEIQDNTCNFKRVPGETLGTAWESYKKCIRYKQIHGLTNDKLVTSFYLTLTSEEQGQADILVGGDCWEFVRRSFDEIIEIMDKLSAFSQVYQPLQGQAGPTTSASTGASSKTKSQNVAHWTKLALYH